MFQLSGKRLGGRLTWDKTDMLYLRYKHQMKTWEKYVTVSSSVFENTVRKMFESSCRLVLKRYGIRVTDQMSEGTVPEL